VKGRILVVLLAVALLAAIAGPVNAGVENNPNAFWVEAECEDDSTIGFWIKGLGASGVGEDGNQIVSKSVYLFDTEVLAEAGPGNEFALIYFVKGNGFEDRTTWCWWYWDGFAWIGNDLMSVKK
jgi:hypothetical protein